MRGDLPLRELNRELGLELEAPDDVTTVGGLATKLAGGIPNRGARLAANDGIVLVVLDATPRMVRRVRVIPPPQPEPIRATPSEPSTRPATRFG